MQFFKLVESNAIYYINSKKKFDPITFKKYSLIKKIYNFSMDMTFKSIGEHRVHRTGGTHQRKKGEIFSDTFQGKLAEFSIYEYFRNNLDEINEPNLERYKLGQWDSGDLKIKGNEVAIKSAKYFSNLLLLETKDWDEKGNYIPNLGEKKIDMLILVRIKPDIASIMKKLKFYYKNSLDKKEEQILFLEIQNSKWEFDIPGYATIEDIISVINSKNLILKGQFLNSLKTKMDADNYYIQANDLRNIEEINFNY